MGMKVWGHGETYWRNSGHWDDDDPFYADIRNSFELAHKYNEEHQNDIKRVVGMENIIMESEMTDEEIIFNLRNSIEAVNVAMLKANKAHIVIEVDTVEHTEPDGSILRGLNLKSAHKDLMPKTILIAR
jgi:hypothetical protein